MLHPDATGSPAPDGAGPGADTPRRPLPPPPSHRTPAPDRPDGSRPHDGPAGAGGPLRGNDPITAVDRLRTIYRAPGPYVSVHLATGDDAGPVLDRWAHHRPRLAAAGAGHAALAAVEARLTLPAPSDTAAVAVLAGADGTTVVDHGEEPPLHDLTVVDTLPYVASLLDWQQRRVPHLVVAVDEAGIDVASFLPDHQVRLETVDGGVGWSDHAAAWAVARRAGDIGARLVVVAGDGALTARLGDALAAVLPVGCRMVTEVPGLDEGRLVDAAIRSAALQGTTVHIIPSTGATGPEDGAAALSHHPGPGD